MHEHIDKLLIDGKEEEAIILIERVWEKERQIENKTIADLARKIDALEKRFGIRNEQYDKGLL
jgi:hypothetical protein